MEDVIKQLKGKKQLRVLAALDVVSEAGLDSFSADIATRLGGGGAALDPLFIAHLPSA